MEIIIAICLWLTCLIGERLRICPNCGGEYDCRSNGCDE